MAFLLVTLPAYLAVAFLVFELVEVTNFELVMAVLSLAVVF